MSAQNRIAPVDGLRTVAAVGVLWAHVWVFMGNPTLSVGTIGAVALDLNRAASIVGTGVDLFFVRWRPSRRRSGRSRPNGTSSWCCLRSSGGRAWPGCT